MAWSTFKLTSGVGRWGRGASLGAHCVVWHCLYAALARCDDGQLYVNNYNDQDRDELHSMSDFLQRESELLGEEFGTPTGGTYATATGDDLDLDRAASAFPEISLDGSGDISLPSAPPVAPPLSSTASFASFSDFSSPPPRDVKVTGDDEIEKFENEFPDIEVPSVSVSINVVWVG